MTRQQAIKFMEGQIAMAMGEIAKQSEINDEFSGHIIRHYNMVIKYANKSIDIMNKKTKSEIAA